MSIKVLSLNLWHQEGPRPERAKLLRTWLDRSESCSLVCDQDEGGIFPLDHSGVYTELTSS